jgi:acyl carrier protein
MPKQSDIADQVLGAFADYLKRDKETLDLDFSLRDDLGLDSMDTIELLYRLEEKFDLEIPDHDLEGFRTVRDLITYLEARV